MIKQKYTKDASKATLGYESFLDFEFQVSSLDVPGGSPLSCSGHCWLHSLHALCWPLNAQAQQSSTAQSTYAEHSSQVLLDTLVVEHGLQGSLWKIHFEQEKAG